MFQLPSVPNSLFRLRRAGWAAGDVAYHSPNGTLVWFVSAHKDSAHKDRGLISSGGLSQEEAWDEAARKAEAIDWQ